MHGTASARRMVWVVSPSKLCNLRCAYCYEWNELGNPARMSEDLIRGILGNVRAYHLELERRFGRSLSSISWLGGEPLLLPRDYLDRIMALEHEILGDLVARGAFYNVVQTNLYRLTDDHIEFLRAHRWKVGISLDVVPGVRLSVSGRQTEQQVIANVARLRAHGIHPDAIAVLAGHTVHRLRQMYDFFAAHGFARIRILPLFSGPPERPVASILASEPEMADALCQLFVHWLETGAAVAVEPIDQYLGHVLRKILGLRGRLYDRARDGEGVIVVNTNGDAYQVVDAYEPGRALGNLGTGSFLDALHTEPARCGRERDAARRAAMCEPCSFAGYCNGSPAMESPRDGTDDGRCPIYHRVHRFMEDYLRRAGIDEAGLIALLRALGGAAPTRTDAAAAGVAPTEAAHAGAAP